MTNPEGPHIQPLGNWDPIIPFYSMVYLGPNSLIVVYMDPLTKADNVTPKGSATSCMKCCLTLSGFRFQGLGLQGLGFRVNGFRVESSRLSKTTAAPHDRHFRTYPRAGGRLEQIPQRPFTLNPKIRNP